MIFALLLVACSQGGDNVVRQSSRNDIVDIADELLAVPIPDSLLISSSNNVDIVDGYLAITDYKSIDHLVYFFDARSLEFINSAIQVGSGPDEISNIGIMVYLPDERKLVAANNNLYEMYEYSMDSLLHSHKWKAENVIPMNKTGFPVEFDLIDGYEGMAVMVEPTSSSKYTQVLARYNILNGECQDYDVRSAERQQITISTSNAAGLCAVAYRKQDLIVTTDLQGNKLKEIQGPLFGQEKRTNVDTFGYVEVTRKHIVASFSGENSETSQWPEKLEVFSLDGEYERTLNVGHPIRRMCYDDITGRIFLSLDDDPQFVYYDFDE